MLGFPAGLSAKALLSPAPLPALAFVEVVGERGAVGHRAEERQAAAAPVHEHHRAEACLRGRRQERQWQAGQGQERQERQGQGGQYGDGSSSSMQGEGGEGTGQVSVVRGPRVRGWGTEAPAETPPCHLQNRSPPFPPWSLAPAPPPPAPPKKASRRGDRADAAQDKREQGRGRCDALLPPPPRQLRATLASAERLLAHVAAVRGG